MPLKGKPGKLAYSVGSIGLTGFLQIMGTFLFIFLTDILVLDPWLAGLIFVISYGVWNGINDPIIGNLSDRTRTRWGRRRPYVVIGTPIMFLFAVLVWSPPLGDGSPTVFLYALIVISLYEFGFTMVSVPYSSVFPEMWTDVKNRSEVIIYRETFAVVGGIIAMVIFPLVRDSLSGRLGEFGGWTWAGGLMAAIFAGSFLFSLLGIRERREFSVVDKPLPFVASLKTAFTNKSWIAYAGADLMTVCLTDWVSIVVPYFAKYSLGMGIGVISIMMGPQLIGTFGFFLIWRKICIRYGTKLPMAASMVTFTLTLLLGLVVRDVLGIAIMGFTAGIAIGGLLLARKLMFADVIDEDEIVTGTRREGVYMGIGWALSKISKVVVGVGLALLLSLIGFVSGFEPPDQPTSVGLGIRFGLFGFPVVFTVILHVFLKFYPLGKERADEISKKIEEIHAEKAKKLEKMKV